MDQNEVETLEHALVAKAWKDTTFRSQLEHDAASALRSLKVTIPDGVKVVVRVQRPDTLYYMIPPSAKEGEDTTRPINQTDFWNSGDIFLWIVPQGLKVALLQIRQSFRQAIS